MLDAVVAKANEVSAKLVELQSEIEVAKSGIAQFGQSEYERGFDEGAKRQDSDKIYSLQDLNEEVAKQTAALSSELDQAKARIAELESAPPVEPVDVEALVAERAEALANEKVAAFKADLKEKLAAQQASESASEADFAALLD